eukprot:1195060-Prorocentrum_minimum.AAC.15
MHRRRPRRVGAGACKTVVEPVDFRHRRFCRCRPFRASGYTRRFRVSYVGYTGLAGATQFGPLVRASGYTHRCRVSYVGYTGLAGATKFGPLGIPAGVIASRCSPAGHPAGVGIGGHGVRDDLPKPGGHLAVPLHHVPHLRRRRAHAHRVGTTV